MSVYPGWSSPRTPGDMMRDLCAGFAACIEEHERGPRAATISYAQAVAMLQLWPTRRNRRALVRLTLAVRRIMRRRPHPARLARRMRIVVSFGF